MKKIIIASTVLIVVLGISAAYGFGLIFNPSPIEAVKEKRLYDFTLNDIDGNSVSLAKYKEKVLLIVNTASKCGNTPQYEGLQNLYTKYKDRGLVVLGFPANNFMGQEPGTEKEIKEFCTLKYNVSFPMFSKISVKGTDQHPLYNFLTNEKTDPGFSGDITWNFEKFLTDKNGKVIHRFAPKILPEDSTVIAAIEAALSAK